jgi:hypothetical protein
MSRSGNVWDNAAMESGVPECELAAAALAPDQTSQQRVTMLGRAVMPTSGFFGRATAGKPTPSQAEHLISVEAAFGFGFFMAIISSIRCRRLACRYAARIAGSDCPTSTLPRPNSSRSPWLGHSCRHANKRGCRRLKFWTGSRSCALPFGLMGGITLAALPADGHDAGQRSPALRCPWRTTPRGPTQPTYQYPRSAVAPLRSWPNL